MAVYFLEHTEGSVNTLEAINHEVSDIEDMINDFKEYVTEQQTLLKNAETLRDVLEGFQQRNEHASLNLPQHLPGRDPR